MDGGISDMNDLLPACVSYFKFLSLICVSSSKFDSCHQRTINIHLENVENLIILKSVSKSLFFLKITLLGINLCRKKFYKNET